MFGPSLTIWKNEVLVFSSEGRTHFCKHTACQLRCLVSFHKSIWVEANEIYWKKGSPLASGKTVLEGDWRNLLLITYQMNLSQYIKRLHCINAKVIWTGYSALRVKTAGVTTFLSPVVLLELDDLKKKSKDFFSNLLDSSVNIIECVATYANDQSTPHGDSQKEVIRLDTDTGQRTV